MVEHKYVISYIGMVLVAYVLGQFKQLLTNSAGGS